MTYGLYLLAAVCWVPVAFIQIRMKAMRYRSTRGDDAELREKLRELANQRRRFGYRRLHILLRRGPNQPPCCIGGTLQPFRG